MALTTFKKNTVTATGTVTAASTATIDVAIATDTVVRLHAIVQCIVQASSHVTDGGSLLAQYACKNIAGTITTLTAATGSTNPSNSATLLAADVEAADSGLLGSGSAAPTLTWSVNSTNARLTITSQSGATNNFDYWAYIDVYVAGI